MSLRLIAKDLYRLQQTVDRLEKELSTAPPEKRVPVERKLVQARIERDQVRQMLDGHLDR
jgi:hypothetical protein